MPRRRNPLWQWILATVTIGVSRFLGVLPMPLSRIVARRVAPLAYYVVPRVKRVSLENLDRAFGDTLNPREKRKLVKGAVDNVAMVAADFTRIRRLQGDFLHHYVTFEGMDLIEEGKGGLVISAHLGNWEWMAPAMASLGRRVAEVVRPLDEPRLDRYIDGIRRATGAVTIPKEGAGQDVIRLLREGYLVGVLIDQQPRESAVPITFFGHPCWGTIAPVMAAIRARVPVYPVSMLRGADGRYTLRFYPAIDITRTSDFRGDLVVNSQRCQDAVEEMIRRQPDQWLWLHRRWKRRERLTAEWQAREERAKAGTNPDSNEAIP